MKLDCKYIAECSGCSWLHLDLNAQHNLKLEKLKNIFQSIFLNNLEIDLIDLGLGYLRDRVDMTFINNEQQKLGLWSKDFKSIVDIDTCPQLSSQLDQTLKNFRHFNLPIKKGSLRLRVSPTGQTGVWLDFSNQDIKNLLDEKCLLLEISRSMIIEIGQRKKRLYQKPDDSLVLKDPAFLPWFETLNSHLEKIPLECTIGQFTQPGLKANHELVKKVLSLSKVANAKNIFEFGSGVGNFTLGLAGLAENVYAAEVDSLALEALKKNLKNNNLEEKVHILSGDFQNTKQKLNLQTLDLIVVDPPRSGLKNFFDYFKEDLKLPTYWLYVSCYPESLTEDLKSLKNLNYQPVEVSIVDQFPQSPHFETVSLFKLKC